jgi:hypothetical protein
MMRERLAENGYHFTWARMQHYPLYCGGWVGPYTIFLNIRIDFFNVVTLATDLRHYFKDIARHGASVHFRAMSFDEG